MEFDERLAAGKVFSSPSAVAGLPGWFLCDEVVAIYARSAHFYYTKLRIIFMPTGRERSLFLGFLLTLGGFLLSFGLFDLLSQLFRDDSFFDPLLDLGLLVDSQLDLFGEVGLLLDVGVESLGSSQVSSVDRVDLFLVSSLFSQTSLQRSNLFLILTLEREAYLCLPGPLIPLR